MDRVTGTPVFTWAPQAFAATYDIQIARNGDTLFSSSNQVTLASTKMSAYVYASPLAPGNYAWRVRRKDADNKAGPWSAGRVFRLDPLPPSLLGPANGTKLNLASIQGLVFQWSAPVPYPKYLLELSASPTFASLLESRSTVTTAWAPSSSYATGTYYWRVKGLNAAGAAGSPSSTWSLQVDTATPTAVSIAPASAAPVTGAFTVTFSEPVRNVSGTTVKAVLTGTSTVVPGTVTPAATTSTTTAVFTPSSVLVPGQSYTLSVTSGITDVLGNPLVPKSFTVRAATTVENGSPALKEQWARIAHASASGGNYAAARVGSSTQTFTFTGTSASILGMKGPGGGYADVYLDGVKKTATPISFYNASTQWRQTMYSVVGLASARHTLQLRALGTKATSATGTWVYLDAFVGAGVTSEENARHRGGPVPDRGLGVGLGRILRQCLPRLRRARARPQFSLALRGTGLTVYATKTATSGAVDIYVDGVKKTASPLSLYSATTVYQKAIWTSATLTDASHAVVIKVVGATAAGSTRQNVGLDKIVIK